MLLQHITRDDVITMKYISLITSLVLLAGCSTFQEQVLPRLVPNEKQNSHKQQVVELENHLAEWKQIKPSLERLMVIEGELRELIIQLNAIKHVESQSDERQPTKQQQQQQQQLVFQKTNSTEAATEEVKTKSDLINQLDKATSIIEPKPIIKYSLQFLSVKKKDNVKPAWDKLIKKHPQILSSLIPIYEKIDINSTVYYRLKAGTFDSKQVATSMCKQLQLQETTCIVKKISTNDLNIDIRKNITEKL